MKLPKPFTIYDLRFTPGKSSGAVRSRNSGALGATDSSASNHQSQSGIALVITLILLSVTLVMALAFLAISRRGSASVTTSTDTTTARLAADNALAAAQGQIIATIYATTNAFDSGLLVSTNYISSYDFVPGPGLASNDPTNVNYYYANGATLSDDDFQRNVANLMYLPRAPVFAVTNRQTGETEFRYYLDLNRDGRFEDTGFITNVDNGNFFLKDLDGNPVVNRQTGDPQWVGVLERPDVPHGPNNKFISRYAFIVLPADGALDLNAIHNQALNSSLSGADGYFRNQGVGSWEINLAAFLADLNTNQWGLIVGSGSDAPGGSATYYQYNQYNHPGTGNPGTANFGRSFEDAFSLLANRYNFTPLPLASAYLPYNAFGNDGPVDVFTFAPLMTNTFTPYYTYGLNNTWSGADNTNHYFDISSDLYDKTKTQRNVTPPVLGFTDRLLNSATNTWSGSTVSTYDRYTFYRLLAQLGTDSAPEANKINLNYSNAVAYYDGNGILTGTEIFPNAETNLVPWEPVQFFTIAADRMLREYSANWFRADPTNYLRTFYGINPTYYVDGSGFGVTNVAAGRMTNAIPAFGVTNIPVQVNGQFVYSPAVQRVLQLAANLYDATTNSFYPSVFRPLISKDLEGNVFVSSYTNVVSVTGTNDIRLSHPFDADTISALPGIMVNVPDNVYGVPWVIGAKKGFPNFNEFTMENSIQLTRKLQFNRNITTSPASDFTTNQMYIMSVTNYLGVEFWNSYTNKPNYIRPVGLSGPIVITVNNEASMTLTNEAGLAVGRTYFDFLSYPVNPTWPSNQFVVPLNTHYFLPLGTNNGFPLSSATFVYRYNSFSSNTNYLDSGIFPLPQFGFTLTNRLQTYIIDYSSPEVGHIVDYVQLKPLTGYRNINREFADATETGLWSTNLFGTAPEGVINQYFTSRTGDIPPEDSDEGVKWATAPVPGLPSSNGVNTSQEAEQAYFKAFFSKDNSASATVNGKGYRVYNYSASMQAPFTPSRLRVQRLTWQANDPLVHYLANDLVDTAGSTNNMMVVDWPANLGLLNDRYMPWGGGGRVLNLNAPDFNATNAWNTTIKDPLVRNSDDWDFPTNKLPTVGWLGRVHRGTPWQTVYLKSENILKAANGMAIWSLWTGYNDRQNVTNTAPLQDRALFDLFTTALNDNATRGQMSVNVGANGRPSLAAWSALLSGVAVPTSLTNTSVIIDPAGGNGTNSALYQMVNNINQTRANFTNADGVVGVFERVGDVLSASALSEKSPFLPVENHANINDALMEWLPQQTLSLLRVSSTPRFVVISYGQTLKPAPNGGVVTAGIPLANGASSFGLVTNYQVVAETATRAVVQVQPVVTTQPDGTRQTNYNTRIEQFNVLPPQ